MSHIPFSRSYWVIPGKFLAGHIPTDSNLEVSEKKISNLLSCGIKTIINLQEEDETNFKGNPFLKYEEFLPKNISFFRKSIQDLNIPSKNLIREIIDIIDDSIKQNKPVYVHCWGGIGRTGTVVGCYLIEKEMANSNNVLEIIESLRINDPEKHRPSPETNAQIDFVKNTFCTKKKH